MEGNTLKVKPGATQVTYTYDCGNGLTSVFSLQVLTLTRIKQVNRRVNTPRKNEMPDQKGTSSSAKALKGRKVNTIASVKRALTRRVRFENRCFMGCSFLW